MQLGGTTRETDKYPPNQGFNAVIRIEDLRGTYILPSEILNDHAPDAEAQKIYILYRPKKY